MSNLKDNSPSLDYFELRRRHEEYKNSTKQAQQREVKAAKAPEAEAPRAAGPVREAPAPKSAPPVEETPVVDLESATEAPADNGGGEAPAENASGMPSTSAVR